MLLLVILLYSFALMLNCSIDTGYSINFAKLCVSATECPTMIVWKSVAHMSSFQWQLCSLDELCPYN